MYFNVGKQLKFTHLYHWMQIIVQRPKIKGEAA